MEIRRILRLYQSGKSKRFIAEYLGISRNTVNKYLESLNFHIQVDGYLASSIANNYIEIYAGSCIKSTGAGGTTAKPRKPLLVFGFSGASSLLLTDLLTDSEINTLAWPDSFCCPRKVTIESLLRLANGRRVACYLELF